MDGPAKGRRLFLLGFCRLNEQVSFVQLCVYETLLTGSIIQVTPGLRFRAAPVRFIGLAYPVELPIHSLRPS